MIGCCSLIIISIGSRCTVLICEQQQSDYVMGNFWSATLAYQSHFRHHLLMCRHLPDGGKLTLTNFHFTHYENGHGGAAEIYRMWRHYML